MKKKIIMSILIMGLIVVAGALSVSASNPTDILKSDNVNGIEVKDGKLYSTNKAHTEIGTVKMINSVDEGEKEIYGYDPEAIEKYVSDDPLVKEYIVEDGTDSSHSGIYWMFGKIEVFGRICSQEEIEHVFLKAKKLQEENKILKEGLQKFRSVGV